MLENTPFDDGTIFFANRQTDIKALLYPCCMHMRLHENIEKNFKQGS